METIVITHHNADLDALASTIAASRLYDGTPIRGRAVNPLVQRYLALHKDEFPLVWYHEVDPEVVERVVIVDVRDRRRLEEYEPILARDPEIIVYDHHPACPHDVPGNSAQVEPTGACVTLLIEHLRAQKKDLGAAEATLMLLGLYADTGRLSFDSTTPRDVDAAGWLLRQGAKLSVVNRYLQEEFSPEQQRLLVELMNGCVEISHEAVEIAIATARADDFVKGAAQVVHRVMQMGAHDAILAVIEFERRKRVQVIGRSRVPYVNVGALLSQIGGGGHAGAAACTLKKVSLDEVVTQVREVIDGASLLPTRVSDMMSQPVQTIDHRATLGDLADLLTEHHIRGVPVTREGEIAGVISLRDLEGARARGDEMTLPVSSRMTHEVMTIAPDEPLEDAMTLMTANDIGRLPVLDKSGRLIGIVSRNDLVATLYAEQE
ncbi:MAG: CBS domain-containing protein [Myxococcota bacterium]|nr:CBS domain-containing protein [Myxococcota bacterium]